MKKIFLLAGAALLFASSGAQAQPYGHDRYDQDHYDHDHYDNDHGPEAGDHGPGRSDYGHSHGHDDYGRGPDHPGHHHWARGEHVPQEYWHHGHEIDWRTHHLRRPPHNYHWVQTEDQYALVGINTGIVNFGAGYTLTI